MLADLGAQVTLLEVAPNLLPGCDEDVTSIVEKSFRRRGLTEAGMSPLECRRSSRSLGTR